MEVISFHSVRNFHACSAGVLPLKIAFSEYSRLVRSVVDGESPNEDASLSPLAGGEPPAPESQHQSQEDPVP